MPAKDNAYIADAASTTYQLSLEERFRLQYEAMEDYYRTQLDILHEMEKRDEKIIALYAEGEKLFAKEERLLAKKEKSLAEDEKLIAWTLKYLRMNHHLNF